MAGKHNDGIPEDSAPHAPPFLLSEQGRPALSLSAVSLPVLFVNPEPACRELVELVEGSLPKWS
ncbi:MAG: hypothetical protein ACLFO5_07005 [Opitutales bacterium]